MALEALAEIVIRVVVHFVFEVLFVGIFYWPGWLILRVVSAGHYPPQQSHPHSREFVAMVAFAALLVGVSIHYTG